MQRTNCECFEPLASRRVWSAVYLYVRLTAIEPLCLKLYVGGSFLKFLTVILSVQQSRISVSRTVVAWGAVSVAVK